MSNSSSFSFPKAGVRFSFILEVFLPESGGSEKLQGWTTAQVCQNIIKPKTQDMSYCEFLLKFQEGYTEETAQVFVSHAHNYIFLDFISALQWQLRDQLDVVVWIDLFSINQHRPTDWTFDWLSTTFKTAVQRMGRTIVVLSPWDNPIPFTRAWCVFEAYCTAVTNSKFEIAMSKTEERLFLEDIKRDPYGRMNQMMASVRSEKSQCSTETDRECIFSVIQDTVGFSKIDSMIFERYREWVIQVSLHALQSCGEETERMLLLNSVGFLYRTQGKYVEAEAYLKECLETRTILLGQNHLDTMRSMNNLAIVLMNQLKYDDAQCLYEECLTRQRAVLDKDHPDILLTMNHLSGLFINQSKYEKAQLLVEDCLEKQKKVLGLDHPKTLWSMCTLAKVLNFQGKYYESQAMYETSLEMLKAVLGEDNPDTLRTMNNLANVLTNQGKLDEAQVLYERCLQRSKSALGDDHPYSLRLIHNFAALCASQGKHEKARVMFEGCLERRKLTLGGDHPDTLKTMEKMVQLEFE